MAYFSVVEASLIALSLPRHVAKISRLMDAFEKRTGERTKVVSGFRTNSYQAKIFADSLKAGSERTGQGYRVAPAGSSKHEYGAATDLHILGHMSGDAATDARDPLYHILAEEGERVGLKPGLRFKGGLPDPYHFEERETISELRAEYGARKAKIFALLGAVAIVLLLFAVLRNRFTV